MPVKSFFPSEEGPALAAIAAGLPVTPGACCDISDPAPIVKRIMMEEAMMAKNLFMKSCSLK